MLFLMWASRIGLSHLVINTENWLQVYEVIQKMDLIHSLLNFK